MNSKFLYIATIAISLLSTLAMADEAPVTREQVKAELASAIADGTLQRTDYGTDARALTTASNRTRDQVSLAYASAKAARKTLNGSDANGTYNPFGAEVRKPSVVTRAEVKADVLQAVAEGTLQRTDYDDPAQAQRRANAHVAAPTFAQQVKALQSHS